MGYYINPKNGTKEAWLVEHGKPISYPEAKHMDLNGNREVTLVVYVWNGAFSAVGIAFDEREREAFLNPKDNRVKAYFSVPVDKLVDVGLPDGFPDQYRKMVVEK